MEIRKCATWQEKVEADHIIATAFMFPWNLEEAEQKFKEQEENGTAEDNEIWSLYDDENHMLTAVKTKHMQMYFDGNLLPFGEFDMVGSLPEARGVGNVRAIAREILRDFKARGEAFAWLFPFSFAYYRKYGFELAQKYTEDKCPIEQFELFSASNCKVERVFTDEQATKVRELYERFIPAYNMSDLKPDSEWKAYGDGDLWSPNFFRPQIKYYNYLFTDENSKPHGFLRFHYVNGTEGIFSGSMYVDTILFDSPANLKEIFGFIYGLRSKVREVTIRLPFAIDFAALIPEGKKAERSIKGSRMVRILDPVKVLLNMRYPEESGQFVIHVQDDFLPENTANYQVIFENGKAKTVLKTNEKYDLSVTVQTFSQLAMGFSDLKAATYRDNTEIAGNEKILQKVFVLKDIYAY